jgi:predicted alpha-1,2-mannosidase
MGGAEICAWAGFDLQGGDTTVDIAIGISYVSTDAALANLQAEAPTTDFEAVRTAATSAWEDELHRVRVLGGSDDQRTLFYTALYHSFLAPTTFGDADGSYRGFDDAVHPADFEYHTDFSLWDTYRTLHPLFNLVQRERHGDILRSLVRMYEEGGDLPKWPLGFGYTGGMVGTPADIVLADAALKEIAGFDQATAYAGARLHATEPRPNDGREGIEGYIARGWVASDEVGSSVSHTLEYAVADHSLGQWAAAMGLAEDAAMFDARGRSYVNHWEPTLGFLIGRRADGTFDTQDFVDDEWLDDYAEGTAWHYLWMVPHDAQGLAALMGGEVAARERLGAYMEMSADFLGGPQYNVNEPVPYYWQSNEPSLHDAYLFTDLGDPASTQRWVDWIRGFDYDTTAGGLPGNDDAGTMSAWYVWSAIGLYPVIGTQRYVVTAPIFERVEIDMRDGASPDRTLSIVVEGSGRYVADARWNGQPLESPSIEWNQLREGGTLRLTVQDAPSTFGAR